MHDLWEKSVGLNDKKNESQNDHDGDNVSNLIEFILGGDPMDRDSFPELKVEFLTDKINHSIGYYSIALTFQFKFQLRLLNPVWTVIVYDHKNPPSLKTILEIDALNLVLIGDIYTEEIIDA